MLIMITRRLNEINVSFHVMYSCNCMALSHSNYHKNNIYTKKFKDIRLFAIEDCVILVFTMVVMKLVETEQTLIPSIGA